MTNSLYELDRPLSRVEVLDGLARTPVKLATLLDSVAAEQLVKRPSGDGWTALQVVGHMRDAAIVYSARFRWMVFDDNPVLPNYDENNWVAAARDEPGDVPAILGEIGASRADLIRVLARLDEAAWSREGRHEVFGTVRLEPYVRHQLAHEEGHLRQLEAALARATK